MGPTSRLAGLATAVSILLGFATLASLVAAFPYFDRADLLALYQGEPISPLMVGIVESADAGIRGWMLIVITLYVATGVVFMVWQHRHATNAVALHGPLGLGPGWAIGAWFVPLGNLVLPFRQLNQSARVSGPLPAVQVAWTGAFVTAAITFAASISYRHDASSVLPDVRAAIARLAAADRLAGAALLLYVVAGVFGVLMVCTLTRRQHKAIALATRGSL